MIYIVTALRAEAEPIVEAFGLSKVEDERFSIYSNDRIRLIVGGIGKVNISIATIYLLSKYGAGTPDNIINIGICSSLTSDNSVGDVFMVKSIIDVGTGKKFMMDKIPENCLNIASISCVDRPVTQDDGDLISSQLVDMESAGFYRAAKVFVPRSRMTLIKVVSDIMAPETLDEGNVSDLIGNNIDKIRSLIGVET